MQNANTRQSYKVYANYSRPMTIELCQDVERNGPMCANICLYNSVPKPVESSKRCFEKSQDLPTCSTSNQYVGTDADIQHMCFLLDQEYWNDADAMLYEDILPKIATDSELCDAAKYAYHLCYWCSPNITCYGFPPVCSMQTAGEYWTMNSDCTTLEGIIKKREWPASTDMCIASKTVGPRCPNVCRNENPSLGCFNETNPPTCNPRSTNFAIKYDIQETCYRLLWDYLYTPQVIFDLSSHEKVLSAIHKDSTLCDAAQQAYHLCYWCDPKQKNLTDDFCSFDCSSTAQVFDQTVNVDVICNELTRLRGIDEWPASIELCHGLQLAGHLCENLCENFYASFIKVSDPKSMSILSRVAAILLFLGASFILWDVLSDAKNRSTVYHQLLVAMAVFDIVTAVAWFFARMPIPKEASFYVEGAMGTKLTCKIQAFFVQLGFTSVLYNVSLASYYVLVICYSWRESDLKKRRLFLHGCPLVVGFGLAFGGIPFYGWYVYGCHLLPPHFGKLWKVLVFAVIPLGFSVFFITVAMLFVYMTVRHNARDSRKWSFGVGKKSLESRVFWQALLYTLSFYITWPILFSVYIKATDYTRGYDVGRYALPALVSFVAPLQGFTNFLVYARPRFSGCCRANITMFGSLFSRLISGTEHSASATMPVDHITSTAHVQTLDPSAAIAAVHHPFETHLSSPVQDNTGNGITECHNNLSKRMNVDAPVSSRQTNEQIDSTAFRMNEKQMSSDATCKTSDVLGNEVTHSKTLPDVHGAKSDRKLDFYFI